MGAWAHLFFSSRHFSKSTFSPTFFVDFRKSRNFGQTSPSQIRGFRKFAKNCEKQPPAGSPPPVFGVRPRISAISTPHFPGGDPTKIANFGEIRENRGFRRFSRISGSGSRKFLARDPRVAVGKFFVTRKIFPTPSENFFCRQKIFPNFRQTSKNFSPKNFFVTKNFFSKIFFVEQNFFVSKKKFSSCTKFFFKTKKCFEKNFMRENFFLKIFFPLRKIFFVKKIFAREKNF